ncbi:unnamed protein product [Leuciscus chuanchicus]
MLVKTSALGARPLSSLYSHSTVIHIPKKGTTKVLNDFRPVALTSLVMKAMERVIKDYITKISDPMMDPLQFAYQQKHFSSSDLIVDCLVTLSARSLRKHDILTKNKCQDKSVEEIKLIRFSCIFIMADSQGSRDGDFPPGCSSVQQKSSNPESSCVSMKSNWSMDSPIELKSGDTQSDLSLKTSSVQQKRSKPESSCVSMKSNCSMYPPEEFKSGDKQSDLRAMLRLCDVTESASVDELLTNLIVGNLLPSALIWITSRPAAADLVPSECVHRVTEVRGFSDTQKEEYFRKRISDQSLAHRIISHLKSSRSLFIMCHIPVFCWISATVLEKMLSEAERGEIPKTLSQMYTHFLIIQTNIKHEKDFEKKVKDEDMIVKLGKLAYRQLVKGNLIFYEEDLRECGIDVAEASVYSGLCTQIFREELGLCQGKVFCFVHLSIQEHLAALYVHLSFINNNINVFDQITKPTNGDTVSLSDLHQRAVDEALHSKNGHLDLFLRFLLGLSVESNQSLLQELKTQTANSSHNNEETVDYIKEKISENPSPDKYINLFHCLNELGDLSLVNEAEPHTYGGLRAVKLSSSQWSALVFVLLSSEETLQEFNLNRLIGDRNDQ